MIQVGEERVLLLTCEGSNVNRVKNLADKVVASSSGLEKIRLLDDFKPEWDGSIVDGGIILDVGCGDGVVGICLAARHNCSLIEADQFVNRPNNVDGEAVPYLYLNPGKVNVFEGGRRVNTVLLVDVLQHVGFGNGWNGVEGALNPDGKMSDMKLFLEGMVSALEKGGKILAVTTDPSGALVKSQQFHMLIEGDEKLAGKVVFV